jgi:hypothetical protein
MVTILDPAVRQWLIDVSSTTDGRALAGLVTVVSVSGAAIARTRTTDRRVLLIG